MTLFADLARHLALGSLLDELRLRCGSYRLLDHWQQGEFHHDVVLEVPRDTCMPGPILVVATNCNGGVKELLCFPIAPERSALWHSRCPDNTEFHGDAPPLLAMERTLHWFDPCELLRPEARSEIRPEFRDRAEGGGWQLRKQSGCGVGANGKTEPRH